MKHAQWTTALTSTVAILVIVCTWLVFDVDDHLSFFQREGVLLFPLITLAISLLDISHLNRVRSYIFLGAIMVMMMVPGLESGWGLAYVIGFIGLGIGISQEHEKTKSEEQKLAEKWDREFGGPATW